MPPSRAFSDPDAIAQDRRPDPPLPPARRGRRSAASTGAHSTGSTSSSPQYRDYNPGDDLRRLDWRVFARSDRHYIKQYEEESNVRVTFVVDASASMNYKGKSRAALSKFRLRGHPGREPGHAPGPPTGPGGPGPLRRGGRHDPAARRQAIAGPGDLGAPPALHADPQDRPRRPAQGDHQPGEAPGPDGDRPPTS